MNFYLGLSINLFVALMISVVGGVTYTPTVEAPISYYYQAEATHTSNSYSYKPGQSGTEFFFYLKEGNDYREMVFVETFGIPTIFYLGVLTFLGLLRKLAFRLFSKNRSAEQSGPVTVFKKGAANKGVKRLIYSVVVLIFSTTFIAAGHNNWWRISSWISGAGANINYQFSTDQIAFSPLEEEGLIWAIDINKVDPASPINEIEPEKAEEAGYYIHTIDPAKRKVEKIDSLQISPEFYSFKQHYYDGELWLMGRPNFLRVYNTKDQSLIYENLDGFCHEYPDLSSGIESYYPVDGPDKLYINTMDGGRYYYLFEEREVVDRVKRKQTGKTPFALKQDNGKRSVLTIDRKTLEGEHFTNGSITYASDEFCVVQHFSDITDNATYRLSAFSSDGERVWQKQEEELPCQPREDAIIDTDLLVDVDKMDDRLVLIFNQDLESSGICCIEIGSGRIIWSFTYRELNEIINQQKNS